ncbi:unnamed protein product [Amoebophrya sp. A120]|nr:unnamed protein product [Amoebophrya sp. A120]|eukprot:GSA120T00000629001.1
MGCGGSKKTAVEPASPTTPEPPRQPEEQPGKQISSSAPAKDLDVGTEQHDHDVAAAAQDELAQKAKEDEEELQARARAAAAEQEGQNQPEGHQAQGEVEVQVFELENLPTESGTTTSADIFSKKRERKQGRRRRASSSDGPSGRAVEGDQDDSAGSGSSVSDQEQLDTLLVTQQRSGSEAHGSSREDSETDDNFIAGQLPLEGEGPSPTKKKARRANLEPAFPAPTPAQQYAYERVPDKVFYSPGKLPIPVRAVETEPKDTRVKGQQNEEGTISVEQLTEERLQLAEEQDKEAEKVEEKLETVEHKTQMTATELRTLQASLIVEALSPKRNNGSVLSPKRQKEIIQQILHPEMTAGTNTAGGGAGGKDSAEKITGAGAGAGRGTSSGVSSTSPLGSSSSPRAPAAK